MSNKPNKIEDGLYGQEEAAKYLQAQGMSLIEANFRIPSAEIDLIMKDDDYIVFVEVKYRRDTRYGLPREAIGYHKQKKIKKAALHYIARRRLSNQDFRFDVVELLETGSGLSINHIKDAFW